MQIGQSGPAFKGDGAMRVIVAQLNAAREMSISQRRQMRLEFVAPNLAIVRHEVPAGTTMLSSVAFEGDVQFGSSPARPIRRTRSAARAVDFGAAARIYFNSDGTLIDAGRQSDQRHGLSRGPRRTVVPRRHRARRHRPRPRISLEGSGMG